MHVTVAHGGLQEGKPAETTGNKPIYTQHAPVACFRMAQIMGNHPREKKQMCTLLLYVATSLLYVVAFCHICAEFLPC